MIKAITIALAYVAVAALSPGCASAQARAWCFNDTSSLSGGPINCGFHTFEQCQAARAGGSSHCAPNPAFPGGRACRSAADSTETHLRARIGRSPRSGQIHRVLRKISLTRGIEHIMNIVHGMFRGYAMIRAVIEEAAALASLALFLSTIAVWAQIIVTLGQA